MDPRHSTVFFAVFSPREVCGTLHWFFTSASVLAFDVTCSSHGSPRQIESQTSTAQRICQSSHTLAGALHISRGGSRWVRSYVPALMPRLSSGELRALGRLWFAECFPAQKASLERLGSEFTMGRLAVEEEWLRVLWKWEEDCAHLILCFELSTRSVTSTSGAACHRQTAVPAHRDGRWEGCPVSHGTLSMMKRHSSKGWQRSNGPPDSSPRAYGWRKNRPFQPSPSDDGMRTPQKMGYMLGEDPCQLGRSFCARLPTEEFFESLCSRRSPTPDP